MRESAWNAQEILQREIKALTFDQYGTIVDMQKGLTDVSDAVPEAKGWDGKPDSFVTWWRRTHFENSMIDALCDRGHTPYRQIGHRAVSHVMDRCGISYTQDEVRWLVGEIETLEAVSGCGRGARASCAPPATSWSILSNGDPRHARGGRPAHRLSLRPRHLGRRRQATSSRTGRPTPRPRRSSAWIASSILFVANHAFDCIGAKSYGMRTAFVDRRRRPFGETPHQPDLMVANFSELASALV